MWFWTASEFGAKFRSGGASLSPPVVVSADYSKAVLLFCFNSSL